MGIASNEKEIKSFEEAFAALPEGVRHCREQIAPGEPGYFEHLSGNLLLLIPPLLDHKEITIEQAQQYIEKYRDLTRDERVELRRDNKRWRLLRLD